jgi:multidrug resistance efflux pump
MMGIGAQGTSLQIARLTRWRDEGRFARILGGIALVGLGVLLVAPWQQNAVGAGQVVAWSPNERRLDVQAPVKGRVVRWLHREGDQVERGEVLVELSDNDPKVLERYRSQREAAKQGLEAAGASVEALQQKIDAVRRERELTLEAAAAQIRVARRKVDAVKRQLDAGRAKARAARLQRTRIGKLTAKGLNSQRDLELAERNAAQADARIEELRAKLEAARSEVASKRAERARLGSKLAGRISAATDELEAAKGARANARSKLAQAERALARQDSLEVRAPRDGMLTDVRAREGSAFVKPGQILAVVVPRSDVRAVEMYISGNDAPLVVPGQKVRLQFEGWPAIQFGGWPKAAVGTFSGEVAFVDARATSRGRFRTLVLPGENAQWPSAEVLRQGNRVNGWILLGRVPLGYELWRQLNGFPPDLPPEAAKASGMKKQKPTKP